MFASVRMAVHADARAVMCADTCHAASHPHAPPPCASCVPDGTAPAAQPELNDTPVPRKARSGFEDTWATAPVCPTAPNRTNSLQVRIAPRRRGLQLPSRSQADSALRAHSVQPVHAMHCLLQDAHALPPPPPP